MTIDVLTEAYGPLIKKLLDNSNGITYKALFLEPNINAIGVGDLNEIREKYLLGILERTHLACITSIARNGRWLEATSSAVKDNNALAFSAALRGLLESAADSHDVLSFIPNALDKSFQYLYLVFAHSPDVENMVVTLGALEKRLIHYAYARRRPVPQMDDHLNKSSAEYNKKFEEFGVPRIKELYGELCELTHPAAASVSCFLDETAQSLTFNPHKDSLVIADLIGRYSSTISLIVQYSINPALMGLSYLNRLFPQWPALPDNELHGISNLIARLSAIDGFVAKYVEGSLCKAELLRGLRS